MQTLAQFDWLINTFTQNDQTPMTCDVKADIQPQAFKASRTSSSIFLASPNNMRLLSL